MFYIINNKIKTFKKKSYKKIIKNNLSWDKKVKNIILNFIYFYHFENIEKIKKQKWIKKYHTLIFDYYYKNDLTIIQKYHIDNFYQIENLLNKIFIAESEIIFPIDIFKKNKIDIEKHNNNVEKMSIIIEKVNQIIFEIRKTIKWNTNKILYMVNYFII